MSRRPLASAEPNTDSMDQLIAWFIDNYVDGIPTSIHAAGIEWEAPGRIERADGTGATDPGGGNALGSPRFMGPFKRRVLGQQWSATEHARYDGQEDRQASFATPLQAAISYIDRNDVNAGAWLRALGRMGGDWRAVGQLGLMIDERGRRLPLPDSYAREITHGYLRRCYRHFRRVAGVADAW